MTVQEAIKNVTAYVYMECENMPQQVIKALDVLKDSAQECEQYRALGTVEELKEAREKQVAKKPIIWENKSYEAPVPNDDWGYECPCCGNRDIDYPEHHCECGQALDWSEEDD